MENRDIQLKVPKRQAALDVWVGKICATMDLNAAGYERFYLTATGGQYDSTCHR